jgi:hypothetical protein
MRRPFAKALAAAALLACATAAAPLLSRPRQDVKSSGKLPTTRVAELDGVSLAYDTKHVREVTAAPAPAAPLESATDKPDWFWPAHVVFDLSAAYPAPPAHARPEIHVAAVEDFRRAASVSPEVAARVVREMRDLRRFLRRRSPAPAGAVPTVPFPDAHEAFRAHLKYVRFRDGVGVAYLTQGQQDESLVTNDRLTYEFRGLTDDGRHYVYASLPVAAPFLPADGSAASHDGYRLPQSFDGPRRAARLRDYRDYVARTRRRLARLAPDRFTPSLRLLEQTFGSLEIRR